MTGGWHAAGTIAAVLGALLGPALAVAWPVQFWVFHRHGLLRAAEAARVVAAALLMPLAALVITILADHLVEPESGTWLRVHVVEVAGRPWPVAPLAFIAVALATAFSTWWALHAARVRPARRQGPARPGA